MQIPMVSNGRFWGCFCKGCSKVCQALTAVFPKNAANYIKEDFFAFKVFFNFVFFAEIGAFFAFSPKKTRFFSLDAAFQPLIDAVKPGLFRQYDQKEKTNFGKTAEI